jgi:hypothetical protein
MVSLIDPSPHDAGAAYLAIDRHKLDDFHPYVFKTGDYGKTWTKLVNGLPDNAYVHAVREDPKRKGLLFAGTETGVFVSFDDGGRWQPLQLNLPRTPIHDLTVHGDDLIVATHGRSFWILDQIAVLREVSEHDSDAAVKLYRPGIAYRSRGGGPVPERLLQWNGENAPAGAVVDYYLKVAPKDEITLEVLDSQGKVIRKLSSKTSVLAQGEQPQEWPDQEKPKDLIPAEAGMNRFVWDLKHEPPHEIPGVVYDGGEIPEGPLAIPGAYQVRLTIAGKSETAPLELRLDPRLNVSPEDLEKQLELAMKIRDRLSDLNDAVNQMRDVRSQLEVVRKRLGKNGNANAIVEAAEGIDKKMTPIEDALMNKNIRSSEDSLNYPVRLNNKLSFLADVVESAEAPPTEQEGAVFDDLASQAEALMARWRDVAEKELAALNAAMQKENIPAIAPAPAGSKAAGQSSEHY